MVVSDVVHWKELVVEKVASRGGIWKLACGKKGNARIAEGRWPVNNDIMYSSKETLKDIIVSKAAVHLQPCMGAIAASVVKLQLITSMSLLDCFEELQLEGS